MLEKYVTIVNELNEAMNEYYLVYNQSANKIDEFQLTVQQENILLLIMRQDGLTANDIAAKFSISKSAVSQVLSKLEAGRFIVRQSNPENLRESFILLGEAGKQYADLISEANKAFVKEHLLQFPLEQLEQVLHTMKEINKKITQA